MIVPLEDVTSCVHTGDILFVGKVEEVVEQFEFVALSDGKGLGNPQSVNQGSRLVNGVAARMRFAPPEPLMPLTVPPGAFPLTFAEYRQIRFGPDKREPVRQSFASHLLQPLKCHGEVTTAFNNKTVGNVIDRVSIVLLDIERIKQRVGGGEGGAVHTVIQSMRPGVSRAKLHVMAHAVIGLN